MEEKEIKSGIYQLTNLNNGKIYIGQSNNVYNRKSGHKRSSNNCVITRAIKKHGWENFEWKILELCDIDKLDEREQHYFDLYKPFTDNKKGYNVAKYSISNKGTKLSRKAKKVIADRESKPVVQLDYDTFEYIKTFKSINDAAKELGNIKHIACISNAARGTTNSSMGYRWKLLSDYKLENPDFIIPNHIKNFDESNLVKYEARAIASSRAVVCLDMKGNFIKKYDSILLAAKEIGKISANKNSIREVCKGITTHCKGFKWKFLSDFEKENPNFIIPIVTDIIKGDDNFTNKTVSIVQLDLQGNFLKAHRSIKDAAIDIGSHKYRTVIGLVCNNPDGGKYKTAHGYKWELLDKYLIKNPDFKFTEDLFDVKESFNKNVNKTLIQLSMTGEFINEHKSISSASRLFGTVSGVLFKKLKEKKEDVLVYKDFKWMWSTDYKKSEYYKLS